MTKGFAQILAILIILLLAIGITYYLAQTKTQIQVPAKTVQLTPVVPTPPPFVFTTYTAPKIEKKNLYTIFMIGDSMTLALGPHGGTFYDYISELYRKDNIGILVDNYARGSTNILSVSEELTKQTTYWDSTFAPLLGRDYDLILVESFGYNPLSQFGIAGGIEKQNQAIDALMTTLITTHPNSAIVFVATIAPNKETYAKKELPNVPTSERVAQAEERMSYIKNHIDYAKSHNIPVINIYEKTLDANGDGQVKYINPDDNIHPSFAGVDFIGHEIANFIYDNQILPR